MICARSAPNMVIRVTVRRCEEGGKYVVRAIGDNVHSLHSNLKTTKRLAFPCP